VRGSRAARAWFKAVSALAIGLKTGILILEAADGGHQRDSKGITNSLERLCGGGGS
jgi:hypothetical protein